MARQYFCGIYILFVQTTGKPSVTAFYNSLVSQLFFDFKYQILFSYQNKDLEELYMIGHDLKSFDDYVNNMYKSTPNYADAKNKPIPEVNWINQWKELMIENPKVKFIKVNPRGIKGGDPVNTVGSEFTAFASTIKYL